MFFLFAQVEKMELSGKPIRNILLVDDDLDDSYIFDVALREVSSTIKLTRENSCEQIIKALDDCSPDLIFLDINLPKVDGFNCLKFIHENETHCNIPIVMYSSSYSPKEIGYAYEFGASLFFTKPCKYADLVEGLRNIILMDWSNPKVIKLQYYNEGRYQPYQL
jgi:PleD family two-component response regulator